MKKLILAFALLAAATVKADSTTDYMLYWQVGESYVNSNNLKDKFNAAQLYATIDGQTEAVKVSNSFVGSGTYSTYLDSISTRAADLSGVTQGTIAGFYVEFMNYTSDTAFTTIGYSNTVSYDTLLAQGAIVNTASAMDASTWSGATFEPTGFTQIPEPTSGLLMLLGLAGLALKRKIA